MSVSIIHMSDLHLGNDIWWRALGARRRWWGIKVQKEITEGLIRAVEGLKPDYVVVSGDFVSDPAPSNFSKSASFLKDLLAKTGINISTRLLVVPGNHDASLYSGDENRRLGYYQAFLSDLFGEEGRKSRFIKFDHKCKAIFLCLDSTLKNKQPLAEGEIGTEQIYWARQNLSEVRASLGDEYSAYAKIAVMHHHCKQIKGMKTSSERFMTLLDAVEIIELLEEFDFNAVLHGHKHYPRIDDLIGRNQHVISIIGAGTTVCPILEEQHQMGNNFNFIKISPETNEISVQMFKANGVGDFAATNGRVIPLLSTHLGYTAREMTKTVTIFADKSTRTVCSKVGIRTAEKTLRTLPVSVSTPAKGAKIVEILSLHDDAEIQVQNRTDTMLDGALVLKEPLTPGREATVAWTHFITGDAALTKKDLNDLYDPETQYDFSGVFILHPAEWISIEVNFPYGMKVAPYLSVEQFGNPLNINDLVVPKKGFDKILNRYTCRIKNPEAGMRIEVRWEPPDVLS